MPLPSKLKFADRIAPHSSGHYFLCQRSGHVKLSRRFDFVSDAKEFRAAHDTAYHNATFRQLGLEPRREGSIDKIMHAWLTHIRTLEVEGIRAPETTAHYELCVQHLGGACPAAGIRTVYDVTPERISAVVRWFRKFTETEGAMTIKALSALKTMIRWRGFAADWKIPLDEIRAQKRQKKEVDAGMIRKLIAAMPHGSIEEAVATLKARTGARDVEIFCARREEFDLDLKIEVDGRAVAIGVFRPVLRNKRSATTSAKRHVYVLTSDAVDRVRPFVARAAAGAYVFTTRTGHHVTRESMRAPIRAAAKKAGFVTTKDNAEINAAGDRKVVTIGAIDTIAQIRSEVVTIVKEETSLQGASDHIGHQDTRTTDRWYVKDRLTLRKLAEKYRPAEIIARAIPLQDRPAN